MSSAWRRAAIQWLSESIKQPTERLRPHRNLNRVAEVGSRHAALHAVGRLHRDGAHPVLAEVLLDLRDDVDLPVRRRHAQRVVDLRKMAGVELDVDDRPDDLNDLADVFFCFVCHMPYSA